MVQHHGWRVEELEEMPPYERQFMTELLIKHLKDLEEKRRRNQ